MVPATTTMTASNGANDKWADCNAEDCYARRIVADAVVAVVGLDTGGAKKGDDVDAGEDCRTGGGSWM